MSSPHVGWMVGGISRVLVVVGLLTGASGGLRAQTEVVLDAASVRVQDGQLTFQFESVIGAAGDFRIQGMERFMAPPNWVAMDGAFVEGIAEGIYRVTLPLVGAEERYVRVLSTALPPIGPAPVINEVMSDNDTAHVSVSGSYWDWIELYNPHDEAIALAGYGLTDDLSKPVRWEFPAVTIQPGAHLLVYATDSLEPLPPGVLVTGFVLSPGGEPLVLTDRFGREVDRFDVPPLGSDQSVGRVPDGGDVWQVFAKAQVTPGRTNGPATATVVVEAPRFSLEAGFRAGPVDLVVTPAVAGHGIAFTTDGSPATSGSPRWAGPLRIATNTVVRAVAVDGSGRVSQEIVRSYLVGPGHGLPVLSIAMAPSNIEFRNGFLTGMGSGVIGAQGQILANFPYEASNAWLDREAAIHLELFETDGSVAMRQHAGMKVYGGWGSRGYPQKSYALFARRKYGDGSFGHEVFPGLGVDSFESLVLRNSGNDNQSTHQTVPRPPITAYGPTTSWGSYFVRGNFTLMRDGMMQRLLAGMGLDTQGYRPAVVYVNGDYWGIHNLREKLTEHHVIAHHELREGTIDLIEGYGSARAGSATVYTAMRDFINNRTLTTGTNYQFVVDTYLDVDNFIDYNLAVVYFQNFDIGNIKCWRPRTPKGRFRWLVYDQDYGFNLWPTNVYPAAMARDYADYSNMFKFATAGTGTSTAWPNAGGRTLLLRRMLLNAGFKERFIRRCADLLNTRFREPVVESTVREVASVVRPEIGAHLARWSWPELQKRGYGLPYQKEPVTFSTAAWETNVLGLVGFGQTRPAVLRSHCIAHFALKAGLGTIEVRTQPESAGRVRVNTITADTNPWSGIYFGDYATTLRPVAAPGWRFVGWSTPSGTNTTPRIDWTVANGTTNRFTAYFEPAPSGVVPPVALWISEINYHSPDDLDAGDWIEIQNPGSSPVDLGGWVLRDGSADGVLYLPDATIPAGGRRVVSRNRAKFQLAHPNGVDPIAEMPFGLDNGGDEIRLMDPTGLVVDQVAYDDRAPWPVAADGGGSTLQLVRPDLGHGTAAAWDASMVRGGTPGQ